MSTPEITTQPWEPWWNELDLEVLKNTQILPSIEGNFWEQLAFLNGELSSPPTLDDHFIKKLTLEEIE